MKRWAWLFAVPVLISVAAAQIASSLDSQGNGSQSKTSQGSGHEADSGDRMFFPRDMFWGWAQFDLAPPHNEIDPNLCAGNAGQYGGANAPCSFLSTRLSPLSRSLLPTRSSTSCLVSLHVPPARSSSFRIVTLPDAPPI